LGRRLLLRTQVVDLLHQGTPLGVGRQELVDERLVSTPRTLAGTDDVGVLTHESQVDHGTIVRTR
jgi:hypothetical protein